MTVSQGLILGTRLWYAFYEDAVIDDEAFTQQMDSLTRGTRYTRSCRLTE
jgi:hypothetical protein